MFRKEIRQINTFVTQKGNYNLNLEIRQDFESTGTIENISLAGETSTYGTAIWGTDKYGGQNLIVNRYQPVKGSGDFFQLKYYNENSGEPWEVKGFEIYVEAGEQR